MSDILTCAREWLGTPYQHQAAVRGVGCDCLGLVRGVYAHLYRSTPPVPPYTPDWAEAAGEETLLRAARHYFIEIPIAQTEPGDVMAFRMSSGSPVKHLGILSGCAQFIHAYAGRCVSESALVPYWERRHTHSFRFPQR
jgi:NlpC/P60 family putative phage cell wall peptidase